MLLPEQFQKWALFATTLGFLDFICAEDGFTSCMNTGKPWKRKKACGIYTWITENGDVYVGQSTSARSRLLSHLRKNLDLTYAAFMPVRLADLTVTEKEIIKKAENQFGVVRNIKWAQNTSSSVPLDTILGEEKRLQFLARGEAQDFAWRDLPVLTYKHANNYQRLIDKGLKSKITEPLRIFIERAIPMAAQTEVHFWSVSVFVQCHVIRINVGQQEVFTLTVDDDNQIYARLLTQHKFCPHAEGPMYQTNCYDAWVPAQDLAAWLTGDRLQASRELIVWLMRHTTTLNSGSHCPQIVRAAFED